MVKTNTKPAPLVTFEGTKAHRLSEVNALRRAVASHLLFEADFYESGEAIADRVKRLTLSVPPDIAATIAKEARSDWKLRHAPLWIARCLASGTLAQKAVVADLLADIIQRPDELAEFLALYWKGGKTPIAASVKRGLARAFTKFNAYQLAKYNRDDAIKLRDVLFLVHATPKDAAQAADWKQLVDGTLPVPNTWEVRLSAGQNKKDVWTELILENELGALALLRNLRNMLEVGVDTDLIEAALDNMSVDRVLPFRFIAAARYAPRLEPFLEKAMLRCIEGFPKLPGRTALIVDTSPSMWHAKVSAKSDMDRFEAAAALAILCREACERCDVYAFNERAYEVPPRSGFALRDALKATQGGASCGSLAVDMATQRGYDRIVILTDGEWHDPRGLTNYGFASAKPARQLLAKPLTERAYLINLHAGRNAVGSDEWVMLDGWSESVLQYIQAVEGLTVGADAELVPA